MAAVLPPQQSSSPSPNSLPQSSSPSPSGAPSLPPLVTSHPASRPPPSRSQSYKNRLSTFSNTSKGSKSRPQSTVFPVFHSSLSYTLVRDFAYPPVHPLFYGPPPDQPSEISTPASEANRRLSDPPHPSFAAPWGLSLTGEQLPQTSFNDGPPWSEDEDLHSPVVTSSRHKKHKSNVVDFDSRGRSRGYEDPLPAGNHRASYLPPGSDASQAYYLNGINEENGHGDDWTSYPPGAATEGEGEFLSPNMTGTSNEARRDSHFAAVLTNRRFVGQSATDNAPSGSHEVDESDRYGDEEDDTNHMDDFDTSRFSRDYQFTIASPDEEMHGKAVALFDFARENDNELPLVEGQIILVSYRHGQGWLVAQDPKTGESGLVPEEYVRLLRDIEGGWTGLMNGAVGDAVDTPLDSNNILSPVSATTEDAKTPTLPDHKREHSTSDPSSTASTTSTASSSSKDNYYTPVVSTFSTSSQDLQPLPKEMLSPGASPMVGNFHGRRPSQTEVHAEEEVETPTDARVETVLPERRKSDKSTKSEKVKAGERKRSGSKKR